MSEVASDPTSSTCFFTFPPPLSPSKFLYALSDNVEVLDLVYIYVQLRSPNFF